MTADQSINTRPRRAAASAPARLECSMRHSRNVEGRHSEAREQPHTGLDKLPQTLHPPKIKHPTADAANDDTTKSP